MGASHGHQKRMRESYLGGKGIAPMNLLVKDHKPLYPNTGLPKTRPVVSGNRSNNGGPSEMVSLILEKVQRHNSALGRTASVISSEDFLHRLERINRDHKTSEEGLTMVATYVSALFPSMTATEAGRAARIKIEESGLNFDGVDYEECLLYLKLNQHLTENTNKLRGFFPTRTKKGGREPGMSAKQVRGPNTMREMGEKSLWKPRGLSRIPTSGG